MKLRTALAELNAMVSEINQQHRFRFISDYNGRACRLTLLFASIVRVLFRAHRERMYGER